MTNNFWNKKMGVPPQQAQAPSAQAPQGEQAPWWQLTSTPQQQAQHQPAYQQTPVRLTDKTEVVDPSIMPGTQVWDRIQSVSTKTQNLASKQERHGLCPECAGTNYAQMPGAKGRCFDCGYPIVQEFSGIGGSAVLSDGKPSQPTRQVDGGQGNWVAPTTATGLQRLS